MLHYNSIAILDFMTLINASSLLLYFKVLNMKELRTPILHKVVFFDMITKQAFSELL